MSGAAKGLATVAAGLATGYAYEGQLAAARRAESPPRGGGPSGAAVGPAACASLDPCGASLPLPRAHGKTVSHRTATTGRT